MMMMMTMSMTVKEKKYIKCVSALLPLFNAVSRHFAYISTFYGRTKRNERADMKKEVNLVHKNILHVHIIYCSLSLPLPLLLATTLFMFGLLLVEF